MNIGLIIWIVASTTLAGSFILAVLITPQIGALLHIGEPLAIVGATVLGALAAIPLSRSVSKAIRS